MTDLPSYGLANTMTGFATLFAGLLPWALCHLTKPHPKHWMRVYILIVVTGIFTITLHGFGETNPVWGERWFWSFLDTGSNILVVGGIIRAVLIDLYAPEIRRWAEPAAAGATIIGIAWHFADKLAGGGYLVQFGGWGGFRPGQTWLIGLSVTATLLFYARRAAIPAEARPVLGLITAIFLAGLGLATAGNEKILFPFLSLHALWHVLGAFGFIALWAFNEVRFRGPGTAGAGR